MDAGPDMINASTSVMGWFVLAFGAWGAPAGGASFELSTSDLWPQAAPVVGSSSSGVEAKAGPLSGSLAVHRFGAGCADGAAVSRASTFVPAACATLLPGGVGQPLLELRSPAVSGPRSIGSNAAPIPEFYVVAPECKNGWSFLGDLSKFATLSPQRFPEGAVCSGAGLSVSVHGAPGETVHVSAIDGRDAANMARVRVKNVTLGANGIAPITFP